MKVAHFYPGLRFKSSIVPRKILRNTHARDAIEQASQVLGRNVMQICQREENFSSTRESFVVSLATGVAVGRYYTSLKRHHRAELIVGSSFGNHAGLVMAGSIEYRDMLEMVSLHGEILDLLYSGHQTLLLRGIPLEAVQTFLSICIDITLIGNDKTEGTAVTFPSLYFPTILHFVKYRKGEYREIPLRLRYHTPFPRKLTLSSKLIVSNLNVRPPSTPFLSTYSATLLNSPGKIKNMLVHGINRPHRIEATGAQIVNRGIDRVIYFESTGVREGK
jgi:hypothetical protein